LVIPVVFKPTPPFFLGRPLLAIELPVIAFFLQISHFLLIGSLIYSKKEYCQDKPKKGTVLYLTVRTIK